ncbi:MAG: BON domain-containing protein [Gemmatimonadota bacterium]|jgi:hypothetical protein|nr:BON domain-containing protein [Gemmatimonadota bacterium]
MAGTFGDDLYNFQELTDDELRTVIVEHLQDQSNLDVNDIQVTVQDGWVTLEGRVGTDDEVQVAGEVLDDLLGLEDYSNNLMVDPLRRGHNSPTQTENPLNAEDSLGGSDLQQSDTAEHLIEDLQSETRGTHDPIRAIRDATSWSPPDEPMGDGYGSREDH